MIIIYVIIITVVIIIITTIVILVTIAILVTIIAPIIFGNSQLTEVYYNLITSIKGICLVAALAASITAFRR